MESRDWPVVITNRCADALATEMGYGSREDWRKVLSQHVQSGARIVDTPPPPFQRRRSPSGWFCVVPNELILPLARDRSGRPQWIATNCHLHDRVRPRRPDIDPSTMDGASLVAEVHVSVHAIQRFRERCGGHPDQDVAERELRTLLARDARAVAKPPAWCTTRKADFFLVALDEFCLPMSRQGSHGKAFDALTCLHRAADLFLLPPGGIAAHCDTSALSGDAVDAIGARGRLAHHIPDWVRNEPAARWWIRLDDRRGVTVAWTPDDRPPLRALALHTRRSLIGRIVAWLRGR